MRNTYINQLINISRPKFISYLAGPFIVGLVAGAQELPQLNSFSALLLLLFFTMPANLYLYGINDLFDGDTDTLNTKKGSQEHLLKQSETKSLTWILALILILTIASSFALSALPRILLWIFLFLSTFYSAPPLRFKARAWLDSYSNVLYVLPAFIGYALNTNHLPTLPVIALSWAWAAAMHLYSAIPDIGPDSKAGITTTAVKLGHYRSLWLVGLNWLVFATLTFMQIGIVGIISFIYPAIICWLLFQPVATVAKVYWWFPVVNTIVGALAFCYFFIPLIL